MKKAKDNFITIQLRYANNTKLTKSEVDDIIKLSQEYGAVEVSKWGIRGGAIDLVAFLEITIEAAIGLIGKQILDAYLKGFIDESFFKGLGESHRKLFTMAIKDTGNYFKAFYNFFIIDKQIEKEAITIVEVIDDVNFM